MSKALSTHPRYDEIINNDESSTTMKNALIGSTSDDDFIRTNKTINGIDFNIELHKSSSTTFKVTVSTPMVEDEYEVILLASIQTVQDALQTIADGGYRSIQTQQFLEDLKQTSTKWTTFGGNSYEFDLR